MIKRGVAKRTPTSELLKSVGKKYSISPETVRWYLKSLKSLVNGKSSKSKSKPVGAGRRRRRQPSAPVLLRKGGSPALVKKAQATARDRARDAAMLKKLLPEYARVSSNQAKLQSRLQGVRQLERAVSSSLRQADKRAKKLEMQLRGLVKS